VKSRLSHQHRMITVEEHLALVEALRQSAAIDERKLRPDPKSAELKLQLAQELDTPNAGITVTIDLLNLNRSMS
jgi:hypothetical protein